MPVSLEQHHSSPGRPRRPALLERFRGSAHEDHLAFVEDLDSVADAHDEAHVVIDDDDRAARRRVSDSSSRSRRLVGLAVVQTRGRLVEQQHRGPADERSRDLDPPLVARTAGSRRRSRLVARTSPRRVKQRIDAIVAAVPAASAQRVQARRRRSRAPSGSVNRRGFWKVRARPARARRVTGCARDRADPRSRSLPRRSQHAGDAVDERRLARPVGPDQAEHLALRELEVDTAKRGDTAEALDDVSLDTSGAREEFSPPPRLPGGEHTCATSLIWNC